MTKSIRKIEKALAKLEVLGSRLSCLFLVAFVFVCVFVALFLVAKVSDFAGSGEALDVSYLIQLTLSLLDFAIYGVILLVMRSIAKDVAQGRSPFTIAHANQIRIIAWLFLTGFVLGILISSGFVSVANAGGFHIGLASDESANYSVISIDVKSVVGAVVCFSLSSVWKYGALLQADSDDYL